MRLLNQMSILARTCWHTIAAFQQHRLGQFVPLVLFLIVWSVLLWLLNSIAPLAPFVYSLI